ncbi:unnamed protein product, partial [Ectocarpus sp. 4 AP-2014]
MRGLWSNDYGMHDTEYTPPLFSRNTPSARAGHRRRHRGTPRRDAHHLGRPKAQAGDENPQHARRVLRQQQPASAATTAPEWGSRGRPGPLRFYTPSVTIPAGCCGAIGRCRPCGCGSNSTGGGDGGGGFCRGCRRKHCSDGGRVDADGTGGGQGSTSGGSLPRGGGEHMLRTSFGSRGWSCTDGNGYNSSGGSGCSGGSSGEGGKGGGGRSYRRICGHRQRLRRRACAAAPAPAAPAPAAAPTSTTGTTQSGRRHDRRGHERRRASAWVWGGSL